MSRRAVPKANTAALRREGIPVSRLAVRQAAAGAVGTRAVQ